MNHALNDSGVFMTVSDELLRSGLGLRFRAYGSSMHPTIRSDESITVVPIKPQQIKQGDIILYRTPFGSVMAHRVIGIDQGADALHFITRGDAATDCDRPVGAEQVLGKVISVERKGTQHKLTGLNSRLRQATRLRASQLKMYLPSRVRMAVRRFRETLRRGQ
ncbi:MAG TPA: signal peptidase I [Pyrinomonadaceae bacterium]|jgi:signal peptidase